MVEIDPITGLPKELSVWENIAKQDQEIIVELEKKKFGKVYTVIRGLNEKDIDISGHVPQGLAAVKMDEMDLVVTLCDYAQTFCPAGSQTQNRLHWSIKDPTGTWGPEWFILRAHRKVRDDLEIRIRNLLLSLPKQALPVR